MDKNLELNSFANLFMDFEKVVNKILLENNFKSTTSPNDDFTLTLKQDENIIHVDIKLYSKKLIQPALLTTASLRLASKRHREQSKLLLVVSSYVTKSLKDEILNEYNIIVWDIKTLFALAFDHADLYYDLETILSKAFRDSINEYLIVEKELKNNTLNALKSIQPSSKTPHVSTTTHSYCNDLKAIPAGKKYASKYEEECTKILKHLFENKDDLDLWTSQNTTDDGFSRNDLLCRIVAFNGGFWEELAKDFHTRYIVFEFKNYTGKIKQTQIFTTEKYLFLKALRSVSFIISRKGADLNAMRAAKGALKEAGKLIVILNDNQLCDMLRLKEQGDEPTKVLREAVDEMLIKLNR